MAPMKIETSGEPDSHRVGPHPSFIQVAKPYIFEQTVQRCLQRTGVSQAKEESTRLLGVAWIDSVRKALRLPVRTFDTAAVYYHKFRLIHAETEFSYVDAAAAALFTACKIEDTLKKSRDILCAAYNLKAPPSDQLSPDDTLFEQHSRTIIGLERLMLEASGFDFRNRHPQQLLVKLAKKYGIERDSVLVKTAYGISLDLYRTFAPLKQTTATMAFACLELAGRLLNEYSEAIWSGADYRTWKVSRSMVMETLLDLLELYTHNRTSTSIGPDFPIDTFLEIRIPLNQEVETRRLPRHTEWRNQLPQSQQNRPPSGSNHAGSANTSPTSPRSNGTTKQNGNGPTPPVTGANGTKITPRIPPSGPSSQTPHHRNHSISNTNTSPPAQPASTPTTTTGVGERGRDGTVRFMLNPEREREERAVVAEFFTEDDGGVSNGGGGGGGGGRGGGRGAFAGRR